MHFDLGGGTLWRRLTAEPRHGASRRSVDGVSLDIHPGETLGLVGESGCGKTTLGRAMLRLVEPTGGRVHVPRRGHRGARPAASCAAQRRHMQMIFQDPYASLDPRMTVGQIIAEPIDTFRLARGAEQRRSRFAS